MLLFLGAAGTALIWLLLSATGAVGSAPVGRVISAVGLLLGVVAVIAAGVALRRLTAPAERLVDAARRIEAGDYSARVPVRGPSELRSLARAFNAMTGRLESDEARRRSVIADVAHELRTPITVIRGQAEGIIDGVYPGDADHMRPVLTATRTLEVLVDDLRTLALAETGSLRLNREPVEVAILIDETFVAFADAAGTGKVRLVATVEPPGLTVDVDTVRMRSALANLVGNALRHEHPGGEVRVEARHLPGAVEVVVRDDGEGIPAELLPRVFDRFVKGLSSPGSGLGLAIVRDIVEAHGGTVSVRSIPGAGTELHLTLPSSDGG
ncbi:MAG: HAMP domain-containing histidine kinase [Candidatus Dormibacteraeota bacterium]|uniref:Signal transduction histidine-protein kinase/phosphatase MprB n=1 Tax=Candidatus Aeolococcus gillhamiae TaxID=3127015 RepID=A0A934MZJ6_9BACT|nr:HAMP domain-containing histidine kinase [Candidatus Dormibacteraeota bacterium]